MKVCPVCKAESFDDMEVCFGCMHRFGEPDEADFERPGVSVAGKGANGGAGGSRPAQPEGGERPPSEASPSGPASEGGAVPFRPAGDAAACDRSDSLAKEGARVPCAKDGCGDGEGGAGSPIGVEAVVLPVSGGAYNLVISFQPVVQP